MTPDKLYIGSGGTNWDPKEFINIDIEKNTNPDLVLDVRKESLPYDSQSIQEIWMLHCIEHIERKYWDFIFMEFQRVLSSNGKLVLGYPEFSICAKNYLDDKDGIKHFWMDCIYGSQRWAADYHVTITHSPEMKMILESYGFYRVGWKPESDKDPYYTMLVAFKDPAPACREVVLSGEVGLAGVAKSIENCY